MKRSIYLIKRVFTMNYKKMIIILRKLHKKTGWSYYKIIKDIIECAKKYQAGYMDYDLFEMYNMSDKERETVLTRGKNNELIRYFNQKDKIHFFHNKDEFNKKFQKFLNRDYLLLNDNENQFSAFFKEKKEIIAKPISGSCGKGIEKLQYHRKEVHSNYELCKENQLCLIEEVIHQHPDMNVLNDKAVNTVRIVTIYANKKTHIMAAYLRIGVNDIVDNFNHGGMVVPIDLDTGIIHDVAVDKKGNTYRKHPVTKTPIIGFQIPLWNSVLKLVTEALKIVPEVGMVGWDVAISDKGPVLVEGNEFPGHDIYQLPVHRKNNIGVYPKFEKVKKEAMKQS